MARRTGLAAAYLRLVRPSTAMSHIDDLAASINEAQELRESQLALPRLLSGEAMFLAMKRAMDELVSRAPQDHDVLIQIGDLTITEARFIEPHTFLFEGFDQHGHRTGIVCHFTQVEVHIAYRPKRSADRMVSRVIQGFSPDDAQV